MSHVERIQQTEEHGGQSLTGGRGKEGDREREILMSIAIE